jgi:hypothetical protein
MNTAKLVVLGREVPSAEPQPVEHPTAVTVRSSRSFTLQAARDDAGARTEVEVAEDDVAVLETDEGIRLWGTIAQLRKDFPTLADRDAGSGAWVLPRALTLAEATRGRLGALLIRALRLLKVDVAGSTAKGIASKIEGRLHVAPGLHPCGDSPRQLAALGKLENGQRYLLFIHGTASSTEGSFGGLWDAAQAERRVNLFRSFDDRVLAFEHRTLSQSPIENAIDLASALPSGARLSIVSHSRGGLVGELLCRGQAESKEPFAAEDFALFADRPEDQKALARLGKVLAAKRLVVERFVRVACPARGTTLASSRLDRYFSIVVNLLEQVPALNASPVFDVASELLLAVVKKRTDPRELPGLEAQMPESPLVRMLNRPGVRVGSDLHVLAGDCEAGGFFGRLKLLATDFYFRDDHDLVVNTVAMFGGAERSGGARFFFHRGRAVNHFNYFRNDVSVARLIAGLGTSEDGYLPFSVPKEGIAPAKVYRGPRGPRPVVFLVPGIMGSHLKVGGKRIWLDLLKLAGGGLATLEPAASGVEAEAVVASGYSALSEFLSATHEVRPFPYDWRLSVRAEGARLGRSIAAALDENRERPVSIVAHSMGGLVSRAMILERPDVWKRICGHEASRLVMLGTPNHGSLAIVRLLLGHDKVVRQLALLDLQHGRPDLLRIISRFPGVLDLLPCDDGQDALSEKFWDELHNKDGGRDAWTRPSAESLSQARATRKALDELEIDRRRLLYVAGTAPWTPSELTLGPDGVEFRATPRGDGRVLWDNGPLPGTAMWYSPAEHGDLANHEASFKAILDLIRDGDTARLPRRPVVSRDLSRSVALGEDTVDLYPDERDLAAAALGSSCRLDEAERPAAAKIRVRVTHGNLRDARHPVVVGHYEGDAIVSAEAHIDRWLGGILGSTQQLGLYPGPVGSARAFVARSNSKERAAVVIGLGQVGTLTPEGLTRGIARGVLEFADATSKWRSGPEAPPQSWSGLSAILIGSSEGGVSIEECVRALLRGVARAASVLRHGRNALQIMDLEIVELFGDRAISAARGLERAKAEPEFDDRFEIEDPPRVDSGLGGLRRASFDSIGEWWGRLRITEAADCSELQFSALTSRARVEDTLVRTQKSLIDGFLRDVTHSHAAEARVGKALFELLVPNRLKDFAPEQSRLALIVDHASARYPWELLQESLAPGDEPLSVRVGLVRQLATTRFRETVVHSTAGRALVVGDPPSSFPKLAGAVSEARKVSNLLAAKPDIEITELIEEPGRRVIEELFAREYRILHLAGHGVFEYWIEDRTRCRSRVTGMVLGDDIFLTAAEVGQMRVVPEVVFINCCHLGRIDERTSEPDPRLVRDRERIASNVATQLIEMGVRCVVAAGWAVHDGAAELFAETFYNNLLAGRSFGEAVRLARRATFQDYPQYNTWGAYQCYGDPGFTPFRANQASSTVGPRPTFVAPQELVVELDTLADNARTSKPDQRATTLALIHDLRRDIEAQGAADWLRRGDVLAAFGRAFGEWRDFESAIDFYQRAVQAEDGEVALRAVEQLANFEARWAADIASTDRARAMKLLVTARRRLKRLIEISGTSERLALLGSACKRSSRLDGFQSATLAAMENAYQRAISVAGAPPSPYALVNWCAPAILRSFGAVKRGRRKAETSPIEDALTRARDGAADMERRKPDVWNRLTIVDCDVLLGLHRRDLSRRASAIAEDYLSVARRGTSARELDSVVEQLRFYEEAVTALCKDQTLRTELVGALGEIRSKLETPPHREEK